MAAPGQDPPKPAASRTPSYLQPTASTAQKAASSASSKRARPPVTKPSASSSNRASLHAPRSRVASSVRDPQPRVASSRNPLRGDPKAPAPKSQAERPISRSAPLPPDDDGAASSEPSQDAVQIAAQAHSWLFMQSNLEAGLAVTQKGAQDTHDALAQVGSSDLDDQVVRHGAEDLTAFLDELLRSESTSHIPAIMRDYVEHEKSWATLQVQLTRFIADVSQRPMETSLEKGQSLKSLLGKEVLRVKSLLAEAEQWNSSTDIVHRALAQLYPVLRARFENTLVAMDAIDYSLDNIRYIRRLRA
ncbi:hypothetical protein BC834DRAFT_868245 [Gloeopeniophorella convolvens]|nr:hypothetical protein BC834DRAFT_868245 [Gloeopeniophorella convolvens]